VTACVCVSVCSQTGWPEKKPSIRLLGTLLDTLLCNTTTGGVLLCGCTSNPADGWRTAVRLCLPAMHAVCSGHAQRYELYDWQATPKLPIVKSFRSHADGVV